LKAAFGRLFLWNAMKSLPSACAAILSLLLAACASVPGAPVSPVGSSWQPWTHQALPGKTPTLFRNVRIDGRDAIAVDAQSSASMLRHDLRIEPAALGQLRFSWKVPTLMEEADLATREKDDAPVRLVLVFEGDRSRFSARDAALSELARLLTGEQLPYATLMYVWCNRREPGTVITSPRTDRIRKLVVESGHAHLNEWRDYERDIRADYQRVFGEAPGALVGMAIMTDSDNTRSRARAWYGPVTVAH
jgi:hypothetical protein